MRKTAILLAGAVVFDLGVMVVSSQAAADMFMKVETTKTQEALSFNYLKIDLAFTAGACASKGGTVVEQGGQKMCRVPKNGAKGR